MNTLSRASLAGATLMAALMVTTQSAAARTVEQSQELTNSAKTSVSCNGGECSGSAESSQTGKQHQKVELKQPSYPVEKPVYKYTKQTVKYVPSHMIVMADG